MNTKAAKDLQVGDTIIVSRVDANAKHGLDRLVVQLDTEGFAVTVTEVREKALVGRGMLVQLSKGALRKVLPTDTVTMA